MENAEKSMKRKKKYEKFIGQLPSLYDFLWY